jgi:hypothetical protein
MIQMLQCHAVDREMDRVQNWGHNRWKRVHLKIGVDQSPQSSLIWERSWSVLSIIVPDQSRIKFRTRRISELLFTVVGRRPLYSSFLRNLSPSPESLMLSFGTSIQRGRLPSVRTVFSWALGARTTVLYHIHDLVTSPKYTPSSVAPTVNSCAAALSSSEFSNLLQSLNIGGHTAMYWAIVNDRREALSALVGYISQISSVCFNDLRIACMLTSDHTLFTQLGLELDIGRKCMPVLIPANRGLICGPTSQRRAFERLLVSFAICGSWSWGAWRGWNIRGPVSSGNLNVTFFT